MTFLVILGIMDALRKISKRWLVHLVSAVHFTFLSLFAYALMVCIKKFLVCCERCFHTQPRYQRFVAITNTCITGFLILIVIVFGIRLDALFVKFVQNYFSDYYVKRYEMAGSFWYKFVTYCTHIKLRILLLKWYNLVIFQTRFSHFNLFNNFQNIYPLSMSFEKKNL